MAIEVGQITNKVLFDLPNAEKNGLGPELTSFLASAEYPWELLGSRLKEFLTKLVDQVPPSERIRGTVSPHAVIEKDTGVIIREGAVVEAHAYVAGPTVIESGAVVRQGAYIRGTTYVGQGAVVGHATETKGALLLPKAKAAHFAYVGDSILGYDCNLGAGTKLANLKFDHGLVIIRVDGHRLPTNLKKFGAILGNRAQTGCNSVTNPGTIMLAGSVLGPNETAHGVWAVTALRAKS